jgi:ammonia channel protein AmtB
MSGAFVSRIKRKSLIIFLFLYVILFLYSLICHYMHET